MSDTKATRIIGRVLLAARPPGDGTEHA